MQYKITEEEKKNIVKIGDSECIILWRPVQKNLHERYLKDGYLDFLNPMTFTIDKKAADEDMDTSNAVKDLYGEYINLEAYVPMKYIFGKNWIFRREWGKSHLWITLPKPYCAYWQVPTAWIKGYYKEDGSFVENPDFDPSFVPERRRLFWPYYGYFTENEEFVEVSDEEFDPEKINHPLEKKVITARID